MTIVLYLLLIQGAIGAFDTFYYHEWRARLPARGRAARSELTLHAMRDYLYAIIFCSLPWIAWHGAWCVVFAGILVAEIVFTLWDFLVEAVERKPLGDVYPGERVTHAIMGILYGGIIARLLPILDLWRRQPAVIAIESPACPEWVLWLVTIMGVGVFISGIRDLYAAFGLPGSSWPWPTISADPERIPTLANEIGQESAARHRTNTDRTESTR